MKSVVPLIALVLAGTAPAADEPKGYLPPHIIDLTHILPPAPSKGDIRYETDREVFRAMKAKIGGPRWQAAIDDVDYATPAMMRDFQCAAGVTLDPASLPAITRLLAMASADTARANNEAKDSWKRPRPFHIDDGQTCQAKKDLGDSYDYPSGHTTKGWTFGLVLADLLPDRAGPLMARAREYGESRIVCRVHNMSAVEAGRLSATVTMEKVRAADGYAADFAAARAELAAAHLTAPDAGKCAAEKAVLEPSVLAGLK